MDDSGSVTLSFSELSADIHRPLLDLADHFLSEIVMAGSTTEISLFRDTMLTRDMTYFEKGVDLTSGVAIY